MTRFKNHVLVVLGFTLAGLIGVALGSGTAQAVVSTLVSVVNPGTSPVHTSSVDDPGRIAYQSNSDMTGQCTQQQSSCQFVFPFVPAGHRVVVQHISGSISYNTAPTVITVGARSFGTEDVSDFYAPIPPGLAFSQFDWPALFYVDSGERATVTVTLYGNSSNFGGLERQSLTLTGYELDCTVAACAPIAAQ